MICLFTGTIDKDYPRNIGGYAFEIGDAATVRIVERARPMEELANKTVCKKDSQDITNEDRYVLFTIIRAAEKGECPISEIS